MSAFLLELFSEEIPARMQAKAASDLKRLVSDKLKEAGLKFERAEAYVTARRLTLHIAGLDGEQPDISEERRGPRADAPEKAIDGFLKGAGVSRDQVEIREEKKGTFLYAVIEKKGRKTAEVLAEFLPDLIRTFPWPKSQRWGAKSLRWVRPLHSILCLMDGDVVSFDLGDGLSSGNITRGHRFLAPDAFEVTDFADYKAKLEATYVILDPADRKALIAEQAAKLAAEAGLTLLEDEGLLNEVVGLAEYPVVLMGEFDKDFLDVPQEALTSAMKSHQKYFSVVDADGTLANKFIFVSNMKAEDHGAKIIDGNQRVLRARLADTKFFWDQDLKHRLEDNLPKLNDIVFHAKLGTVGERVTRLVALSGHIAEKIGADVAQAKRAAELCKADLVSGMVGEFADLQGLMGKYYAEKQGEPSAVANAIAEHYSPKGPSDKCPSDPVSVSVALAEKLDSLIGFFLVNEMPTGSKDPFALRRAALGIIRLIVENKLRLNLLGLIENSKQWQNVQAVDYVEFENPREEVPALLMNFFEDRLKVHLKEQGVRHDLITAVFSLGGEDDLVRLLARVEALQSFLSTDDGANLLAGFKRAANILKAEEKKDGVTYGGAVKADLLVEPAEKALYDSLMAISAPVAEALAQEKYDLAMTHLATLRAPIDQFFEDVTVNSDDKDVRDNRLKLLTHIRTIMNGVANFSEIEG
ncbi:glycine--tRNA ligase subunit beta [Paremcibacter congregatus]|uniref:Glycine--tRNA ligase beta subunit n=1 Tax=Paremcibacter congregatus TaxID=2043170 RepID=A0A2G4YUA3_9PROT|nr:glycine--tRNA ligase subunit beta [Paremcibacter congregatus]PHZ85905.1 glycine--tRNA ligase subunit beta [Paremcibacter congregatus]QDE26871.1 glycine--tRNA ligase subunit beta [Paremcibacter congregatus]